MNFRTGRLPYHAHFSGETFLVRPSSIDASDEPGRWTLEFNGRKVPIDEPQDLLNVAPVGSEVQADFGPFALVMRRTEDGFIHMRGRVRGVEGPELLNPTTHGANYENALWAFLDLLGEADAPRACFFCRFSEVEPCTGWGHVACLVDNAESYDHIARSQPVTKWVIHRVGWSSWVDEWFGCARFEVRPKNYGYRGR